MASLMLLLDVLKQQKEKLMIEYIQLGIDLHGLAACGRNWLLKDGATGWAGNGRFSSRALIPKRFQPNLRGSSGKEKVPIAQHGRVPGSQIPAGIKRKLQPDLVTNNGKITFKSMAAPDIYHGVPAPDIAGDIFVMVTAKAAADLLFRGCQAGIHKNLRDKGSG